MSRALGNISCDHDPLTLGSRPNNVFSCKCISLTIGRSNFKLCRYIGQAHDVEGIASCDLDPACDLDSGSRSNQKFLVNAFPPKPLDIATSNFTGAYVI